MGMTALVITVQPQAGSSTLDLLRSTHDAIQRVCTGVQQQTGGAVVQIAAHNSPHQVVLSGHTAALDKAVELLRGGACAGISV